jgi:hypothetical protein
MHFPLPLSFQRIRPIPRPCVTFRKEIFLYGEEMLAPRPTPKLEDHLLSAVHNCLFYIFAATLHIRRQSPPTATWGRAMPWWQGLTHIFCAKCSGGTPLYSDPRLKSRLGYRLSCISFSWFSSVQANSQKHIMVASSQPMLSFLIRCYMTL